MPVSREKPGEETRAFFSGRSDNSRHESRSLVDLKAVRVEGANDDVDVVAGPDFLMGV